MDLTKQEYFILHPDPAVGKVMRSILREAGAQAIHTFEESVPAIDAVRNGKGDVLLVDERLCGPGDWPVARGLRQAVRERAAPVAIFMAAAPTRQVLEQALSEGYASVIAVPFSVRTFTAHVERAFRSPSGPWDLADRFLVD